MSSPKRKRNTVYIKSSTKFWFSQKQKVQGRKIFMKWTYE